MLYVVIVLVTFLLIILIDNQQVGQVGNSVIIHIYLSSNLSFSDDSVSSDCEVPADPVPPQSAQLWQVSWHQA